MRKKLVLIISLLLVASIALAACQKATPAPEVPTEEPVVVEEKVKVCQITDTGGIDDKSFNATAWKGITTAQETLGIEGKYLESKEVADYEKFLNAFIEEKCDLIVTVGFLIGDATKAAAEANPDAKFSIVDYNYDPAIANVVGQIFDTDEAATLAGYLAAGVTKTGVVGTFGGLPIPTVTIFMDGFVKGVNMYNAAKGTDVKVLGWDAVAQTGLFSNSFDDQQKGNELAKSLMDEGADIIMPVAGPVGLGAAAAIKERGNAYLIGVDSDWALTSPEYADITLTSVMKLMDATTLQVIQSVIDGTYAGGDVVGTLANGGVAIAPYHDLEGMVPAELTAEIEQLKADIISGTAVAPVPVEKSKICQITDTGGIDDKSFNATAWKGITTAQETLGIEGKYLESKEVADYEKFLNAFIEDKCDLIVTVGFLIGDATKAAAEANPDAKFSIVDYNYDPAIANVVGQIFDTDEAAVLAGYLAAGVTKTGVVGTFGGLPIPTVTIFMDGFVKGVEIYNAAKGTNVTVLGWDVATQTGLFSNSFDDQQKGNELAKSLMDEGADIIMPVAGPVGLGAAAAIKERGNAYLIGVDSDWALTSPEYADITLTSVMKLMDATTLQVIQSVLDGTYVGGDVVGTLANGGVAIAPYHDLESIVPAELTSEIEQLKADIISGVVSLD
ncbi:MAG: BMP family ABC transporter substrate-binding protein [Anaerolineaceae bacterium]